MKSCYEEKLPGVFSAVTLLPVIWRRSHRSLLRRFSRPVYLATSARPRYLTNCSKGHYLFCTLLSVILISIYALRSNVYRCQMRPRLLSRGKFVAISLALHWVPVGNLCNFPAADCDEAIAVWTEGWQLTENCCRGKWSTVSTVGRGVIKQPNVKPPAWNVLLFFSFFFLGQSVCLQLNAAKQPHMQHRCAIAKVLRL